MKMKLLMVLVFLLPIVCLAQDKWSKDLDGDGIKDTVFVDGAKSVIVCQLSSQDFKRTESKPFEVLNETSGIREAKGGFAFFNSWMRAGYEAQFRYNKALKQVQLIGMSRYEFGNASNDGSGESSVNVLTNRYIGNWNYWDLEAEELVKIPTLKSMINFGTITLAHFGEDVFYEYAERCAALYAKAKAKLKAQKVPK